jgi:peptidyl-tRNA hydrolase, PTH1 family
VKLIVGLGNPGPAYETTRHNAGFLVCDILGEKFGLEFSKKKFKAVYASGRFGGDSVVLLKPQTFMNLSGQAVAAAANFFQVPPGDMIVIHDDVDLPPGRIKLKLGGGSGGHKGIDSIVGEFGESDFYRLRVGVGRPENPFVDTADFVLEKMGKTEWGEFKKTSEAAADAAICLLREGLTAAQNKFHAK